MADRPVRWGILGTGGIATTFVTDLGLTDSGVAVAVGWGGTTLAASAP